MLYGLAGSHADSLYVRETSVLTSFEVVNFYGHLPLDLCRDPQSDVLMLHHAVACTWSGTYPDFAPVWLLAE